MALGMKRDITLKLSRLRDIGWSEWDPIGLLPKGEIWDHQNFADEYDSYLLEVAGRLCRDWSMEDAAKFLVEVENIHMGLGVAPSSRARAEATARSIKAYVDEIGGDLPLSFSSI